MPSVHLRQVEAFRAVMETGSVTRAAEAMRVSQPAVSKLLRHFADDCGFALFERSGGRLVPTPEARQLMIEVERVFGGADRIAAAARAIRERRAGQVTIASFAALAVRFVPRAITPFLAARADVHVSLSSRSSPRIIDLVVAQQVDVGLSLLPVEHPFVTCSELSRFDMLCAVPAAHPLAKRPVIRARDLENVPFVALGREDRSRFAIDHALLADGVRPRVQIETQLAESACAFVAGGLGAALIPPFIAGDFAGQGVVAVPFEPKVSMCVWLLLPSVSRPSRLTLDIVEEIRRALAASQEAGNAQD